MTVRHSTVGSGSFGSYRSPLDLYPVTRWPSGHSPPLKSVPIGDDQERPSGLLPLLQCASSRSGLLKTPCCHDAAIRPPLLGLAHEGAPPPTYPVCVHSRAALLPLFGLTAATRSDTFRPRGFPPPRQFTPHTGSQVCCTLQPAGVRRAFECRSRHQPKPARTGPNTLPRDARPSKKPFVGAPPALLRVPVRTLRCAATKRRSARQHDAIETSLPERGQPPCTDRRSVTHPKAHP